MWSWWFGGHAESGEQLTEKSAVDRWARNGPGVAMCRSSGFADDDTSSDDETIVIVDRAPLHGSEDEAARPR